MADYNYQSVADADSDGVPVPLLLTMVNQNVRKPMKWKKRVETKRALLLEHKELIQRKTEKSKQKLQKKLNQPEFEKEDDWDSVTTGLTVSKTPRLVGQSPSAKIIGNPPREQTGRAADENEAPRDDQPVNKIMVVNGKNIRAKKAITFRRELITQRRLVSVFRESSPLVTPVRNIEVEDQEMIFQPEYLERAEVSPKRLVNDQTDGQHSIDNESKAKRANVKFSEDIRYTDTDRSTMSRLEPNKSLTKEMSLPDTSSISIVAMQNYTKIRSNIIVHPAKLLTCKEYLPLPCDCTDNDEAPCSNTCVNKLMMIECSKICPAGALCQNQNITRRAYCEVEVRPVHHKGLGLGLFAKKKHPSQCFYYRICGRNHRHI